MPQQRTAHSATPVCVLGLGLIGGSILRALHRAGRPAYGWNRSAAAVDDASAAGFDASSDLVRTLRRANDGHVIVVAVPVPALREVLSAVAEHSPNAWLTDAASVKGDVATLVAEVGLTDRYAGGHPMAGTEHSGWLAADSALFEGATWVVTVDDETSAEAWRHAASVGLDCGAVIVPAGSSEHDAAVARISHSVHLVADAVATTADPANRQLAAVLAAGSFRDATRVAGTAPSLVQAMCEVNRTQVLAALDQTIAELASARAELAGSGTVRDITERGYAARSAYEQARRNPIIPVLDGNDWRRALRDAGHSGAVVTDLPQ